MRPHVTVNVAMTHIDILTRQVHLPATRFLTFNAGHVIVIYRRMAQGDSARWKLAAFRVSETKATLESREVRERLRGRDMNQYCRLRTTSWQLVGL